MFFKIIGGISDIETIASGTSVRERRRIAKALWRAHLEKAEGMATVELPGGNMSYAEVHWYERHGIGAKEFKN